MKVFQIEQRIRQYQFLILTIASSTIIILTFRMLPEDQIRFLSGILISIPLSFALRFIGNYQARKIYSLILGILFEVYVYGQGFLLSFGLHFLMYFLIKTFSRQHCGLYTTFTAMVVSSSYHIYVMIVDYGRWEIDISTILMMSICKYSLFAFSYQDGQEQQKLQKKHKQRLVQQIKQLPSFYDFLGYMIFLPSSVINTPFDYSTYDAFMKKEKQFNSIPLKPLLIKFGKQFIGTLVCLVIYVLSTTYLPTSVYSDPQTYMKQGMLHHIWYGFIATNLLAAKYFFGFKLMQLPIHASGVSYKPSEKQEDQFQGIRTVAVLQFEKSLHLRDRVASWNISVQQWLRKCVYERLPYDKSTNQFLTFMVSAFWHGFYPGYYVTFGLYFLQIYTGNVIFKFSKHNKNHPIIQFYHKTGKIGYCVIWLVWIWIFLNNSVYFPALSGYTAWYILSEMRFATPLFLVGLIIFFKVMTPRKKSDKRNQ